jgi:predicted enzyme related to lactoylglutathione lyase
VPANLASFALHVDDVDRARSFYEHVFEWRFEAWGPPGFFLIHTGDEDSPGIQGILHARTVPRAGGGLNGIEPTFAVDDLDEIARAVTAQGGTITVPPSDIPTVGRLLRFLDPDGNDIGAMVYEHQPHT